MIRSANMASLASQADSPSQGLTSRGGGWQAAWAQAVRCPTELCRLLHLPSALADDAVRARVVRPEVEEEEEDG